MHAYEYINAYEYIKEPDILVLKKFAVATATTVIPYILKTNHNLLSTTLLYALL